MYNIMGYWPFNPLYFVPILLWSLAWKGIALWKAAKHEQKAWFVALLIVNTVGLLEIAYILFFQKTPVIVAKKPVQAKQAAAAKKKGRKRK